MSVMDAIKKLRFKTSAGVMECKAALKESGGDIDKAVEILLQDESKVITEERNGNLDTKRIDVHVIMFVMDNGSFRAYQEFLTKEDAIRELDKLVKDINK